MQEFVEYRKIARLNREMVITEKIDGTNAQIVIPENGGPLLAGSRTRWITPEQDNYGFAKWVQGNEAELRKLGPGIHFGEWWGQGIQRKYGLQEKRFSLFNVGKWIGLGPEKNTPDVVHVVPILYKGQFDTRAINAVLADLQVHGSFAAPGFMNPEGIVVFHVAAGIQFKVTLVGDEKPKSLAE